MRYLITAAAAAAVLLASASAAQAWHTPDVALTGSCPDSRIASVAVRVDIPAERTGIGNWRVITTVNGAAVRDQPVATGSAVTVQYTLAVKNGDVVRTVVGSEADMTDGHAEDTIVVNCPPITPPTVTPPASPPATPPTVAPCIQRSTTARIVRRGHRFHLTGDAVTHIRWRMNGHLVGRGRHARIMRFRGRTVEVRFRVSECQTGRLTVLVPRRAVPPPRFAG